MYSKWYRYGLVEKKLNRHFTHLCTSALLLKQWKTSQKNGFLFTYIFTNIIFVSKFDVFEMVQVASNRQKKTIVTSLICALLHSSLNSAKPVNNRFLFNYIFKKTNILISNSMYSKGYS